MSLEKKINNNSKEKNKDDIKEELSELMSKLVNIMNTCYYVVFIIQIYLITISFAHISKNILTI